MSQISENLRARLGVLTFKEIREAADEIERLETELITAKQDNGFLRKGLSNVAENLGNGSKASALSSVNFLANNVPHEVKICCDRLRTELAAVKEALGAKELLCDLRAMSRDELQNEAAAVKGSALSLRRF